MDWTILGTWRGSVGKLAWDRQNESNNHLWGLGYLREFFAPEDMEDEDLEIAHPLTPEIRNRYEEPLNSFVIKALGFSQSLYRLASKDAVADLTADDLSKSKHILHQ